MIWYGIKEWERENRFTMEDNILNIKKEMIKKAKIKDLSRLEKYMSVQKEIQYLNFEERKLLIAELKRDLKAIDGMSTE